VAAASQRVRLTKTASFTTVAAQWSTTLDVAGMPGAGSLAIANTTTGLVPTDATAGFPTLWTFGGGATGYLSKLAWGSTVACRLCLFDRLWHAGSVSMTSLATTTFSSQPSYLARTPDGAGVGVEIWCEINAAVSSTATTLAVGYTNSDGTAGRTTGATASLSGYIARRLIQLPYQAGDKGVQKIDSITVGGTVATTGSVNVIAARPLFDMARVKLANDGNFAAWDQTLMPVVYDTSALWLAVAPDSTAAGIPDVTAVVSNG
jgi:hypothetical protein